LVSLRPQREKKPSWVAVSLIFDSKIHLEVSLATRPPHAYKFSTLPPRQAAAGYTFAIFLGLSVDRRFGRFRANM
jgi:hypothetical protein